MKNSNVSMGTTEAYAPLIVVNSWDDLSYVLAAYVPFALDIDKYVTPVWCITGIIGNVISTKIWMLRRMRKCNTSALYLVSLAIADLSFLVLHVFFELQYPWQIGALDLQGWCQTWNVLYMTTQYVCMLLVLAFTVERFLSVCHPFECERFSRSSRSPKIVLGIVALSFSLALPQAYFWQVGGPNRECKLRDSQQDANMTTFYSVWNWSSEMAMFAVVPLVVLILNICVLRQIKSVGKLYVSESVYRSVNVRCTTTTVTLLWISFYLICTKLPVTIVFAIQTSITLGDTMTLSNMAHDSTWQTYFTYFTVRKIVEEIGISHHACNGLIYCATSKQFRRHFKGVFVNMSSCQRTYDDESDRRGAPHGGNK